jgi:hypothetical protein
VNALDVRFVSSFSFMCRFKMNARNFELENAKEKKKIDGLFLDDNRIQIIPY